MKIGKYRTLLMLLVALLWGGFLRGQDVIRMEKAGGVYRVPCKINGLALKFIFDTGASDASISLTEALFMYKNDYLKESDFRGTEYYRIANGDIQEGTKVILKTVEIGNQKFYNVEASIVHNLKAPLLFGQSVLERFGSFTIDYKNSVLIINGSNNRYKTEVTIGKQVWMTQNLNVDKFRNGDPIPEAKTDEDWEKAGKNQQPAWCYYDNDPANGAKYGKLYNWYAVNDSRGLAPVGYHIPSDAEWTILTDYLGGDDAAGTKMKSTSGWAYNGNGTNESGFSGLPGGFRGNDGSFFDIGSYGYWWSSTEDAAGLAWYRDLGFYYGGVYRNFNNKQIGFSVRCLRD